MNQFEPTVGPIVGHTTSSAARIWVRGNVLIEDQVRVLPCTAAIRYRNGAGGWSHPFVMKREPYFDGTAVFVLEDLAPDTGYDYQIVCFEGEAQLGPATDMVAGQLVWPGDRIYTFRTQPADDDVRSFVAGSCRYLLTMFGGLVFDERGDKIYDAIRAAHDKRRLHGLLLIGDQIYADDLGPFGADDTVEEFFKRYRRVFAQPFFRRLLNTVPTYMMLDDHEIENNWPQGATSPRAADKFKAATHAYQVYQASHSPVFDVDDRRIVGIPKKLWYEFSNGKCDFFVMDTRTERVLGSSPPQILGPEQMKQLLRWLARGQGEGRIKIVVSAVPFLSVLPNESEDKWSGFEVQRNAILQAIQQKQLRNIVFVSGDVHCSFACTAELEDVKVHQIVSSPLFWALPHALSGQIDVSTPIRTDGGIWALKPRSRIHRTDNFARFDVDPLAKKLMVGFYDRKGKVLEEGIELKLD